MALNNETIVGQDLVAWVMCGIVHVPRSEVCHPPVHVGHPLLIYTLVRTESTCLQQKYLLYMHLLYVCLLSNVDRAVLILSICAQVRGSVAHLGTNLN